MAPNPLQLEVLHVLAHLRRKGGESYVAGGVALNHALHAQRRSNDVDLFHDTDRALVESYRSDCAALERAGFTTRTVRETRTFVEVLVRRADEQVLLQWVRDSAYRFFPLIESELFGLTLHPLDLATNKILALVGRLETRDWVDTINCHLSLQRLGYLFWAACGKDEGYSPGLLLQGASRQRYTQDDIELLEFDGEHPSARVLGTTFKAAVEEARVLIDWLPTEHLGTCLLHPDGSPYAEGPTELANDLRNGQVRFHRGRIGGVWPSIVTETE